MLWAQKANPTAHAAHVYREQLDIKMLQKKKKSRELSSMLWMQKSGSRKSGLRPGGASQATNVRSSMASEKSETRQSREGGPKSMKSVVFAD